MAVEIHLGGEQSTGIAAGYGTVRKEGAVVVGRATLSNGKAAFSMEDRGAVSGGSVSVSRKLTVTGSEPGAGILSAVGLAAP